VAFARLADFAQLGLRRVLGVSSWWPWLLASPRLRSHCVVDEAIFRGARAAVIPQTIFAQPEVGEAGLRLMITAVVATTIGKLLSSPLFQTLAQGYEEREQCSAAMDVE
jgi:hypothetical protein